MEVCGITMGNVAKMDANWTIETFAASKWAATSLGKLFIALSKETIWSNGYSIEGHFLRDCWLSIHHPLFPPNMGLHIHEKDVTENTTVGGVEIFVRAHLQRLQEFFAAEERLAKQKRIALRYEEQDIAARQRSR